MASTSRRVPSHGTAVAYLALFVALGGTAVAVDGSLPGQNTVGAADIINNDVRSEDLKDQSVGTTDLRGDAVTTGKLAPGAVESSDVLDNSLTPADLSGVEFQETRTARLTDPTVGGANANQFLFTIGRVKLGSFCVRNAGGTMTAGINPGVEETDVSEPRPLLVTDGEGPNGDGTVDVNPFDAQWVKILSSDTVAAEETSFAILDSENTSASGVAAVSVNPATNSCVITVSATG